MAPDGQYGEQDENGNWNGIMGELVNRKADIGLGAISVMAERESVIDFTVPYYDLVGTAILMKKAKVIYASVSIYIKTYHFPRSDANQLVQIPVSVGRLCVGLYPGSLLRHVRPSLDLRQVVPLQLPEQHGRL